MLDVNEIYAEFETAELSSVFNSRTETYTTMQHLDILDKYMYISISAGISAFVAYLPFVPSYFDCVEQDIFFINRDTSSNS